MIFFNTPPHVGTQELVGVSNLKTILLLLVLHSQESQESETSAKDCAIGGGNEKLQLKFEMKNYNRNKIVTRDKKMVISTRSGMYKFPRLAKERRTSTNNKNNEKLWNNNVHNIGQGKNQYTNNKTRVGLKPTAKSPNLYLRNENKCCKTPSEAI